MPEPMTAPIYPAPGSEIPGQPGYVVGKCEHRVAASEWRAGFRVCERCPYPDDEAPEAITAADFDAAIAVIMERPSDKPLDLVEVRQVRAALDAGRRLTRARIVPADAIVLERPTDQCDAQLMDYLQVADPVSVNIDGHVVVAGADETGDPFELVLNRVQVNALAARMVLAANEAEAEDAEKARKARRDRLADLADSDCERCDGTGLDPDVFTTSDGPAGTVYHLTEPCRDCIDEDDAEAMGTDVTRVELHDSHAVGEDEPAKPSTWMDRDPVDEILPGSVYATEDGELLIALGVEEARLLTRLDGHRLLFGEVGPLRLAGMIPASVVEAIEIDEALTALTGTKRVPADAIVLERPTEPAELDLLTAFEHIDDGKPVFRRDQDGTKRVVLAVGCGTCDDLSLTRRQARTMAALLTLAADEAERGQG